MNQSQPVAPQGNQLLKWLILILVIVVLAGGGYLYYLKSGSSDANVTPSASATPTAAVSVSPKASASIPSDWKTYLTHGFSLKAPATWTLANNMVFEFAGSTPVQFKSGAEFILSINRYDNVAAMPSSNNSQNLTAYINQRSDYYQTETLKTSNIGNNAVTQVNRKTSDGVPAGKDIFVTDGTTIYRLVFNETNSAYTDNLVTQVVSTITFSE